MNSNDSTNQPLSIRRNMLWNTVGSLVYQGCLWLITILVVILAGYDDSGLLAYAMAIGNIYFPLAIYNMRTIQVSDVDEAYSQQNYVAFRLVTITLASIVLLVYLGITVSVSSVFVVSLCWIAFRTDEALSNVYYGIEQKHMRMDYIGKSQLFRGLLVVSIFSLVIYFTQSVPISILTMMAACLCVTFFYDKKNAERFASVSPHITKKQICALLKKCLPSTLSIVVFGAVVTITRQFYEAMCGTELLGIYAAIATPTVLINALTAYLYTPYIGPIASSWKKRDIRSIAFVFRNVFLTILIFVIIFCIAGALWGSNVLELVYGPTVLPYADILLPTIITIACTASAAFLADAMIAFRQFKIALTSNIASLMIAIAIGYPTMSLFGMNGINITLIISYIAGILICLVMFAVTCKRTADARPF